MIKTEQKIPLIRKTSRTFFLFSGILMAISTVVLFFYVRGLLRNEIEEELFSTEDRIERALLANKATFSLPPVLEVAEVSALGRQTRKDTVIFDPSQNEMEDFRQIISYKEINGKKYRIIVRTLIVESEAILVAVVASYLIIIFLVFVILFYFSKARNQKLWHPFFTNLEQMKQFSLSSPQPLQLADSDILEFHELNEEIKLLTGKVKSDYLNLKQFTENVSHELQTPLAIIQAKIENIINGDDLNDMQFERLTSIQKDIQRLAHMNKRLTLLTKIENRQFVKVKEVALTEILGKIIEDFHEISVAKINFLRENELWVTMDPYLADVLCTNLISNAIKHNTDQAAVEVVVSDTSLVITNCGTETLAHPENLYTRFYRESETEKSTGLGLAIVKRICDLYGFSIRYTFSGGRHIFSVCIG